MTPLLPIGLAGLVLLAGLALAVARRRRSRHTEGTLASASSGFAQRELPESAGVGIRQLFLPDPSFGWWPISGDLLLLDIPRTPRPGP